MKRFTLLALTLLMSVVTFAQKMDFPKKSIVRNEQPVSMFARPAPEGLVQKTLMKAKKSRRAVSAADLVGSYRWDYQMANGYAIDPASVTGTDYTADVKIEKGSDANTIVINGMFTKPLTATQDTEGYFIIKDGQLAGTSSNYGDYVIRGMFYFEGNDQYNAGWYWTDIYAYPREDGVILLADNIWLARYLTTGSYAGYTLTPYYMPGSNLTLTAPGSLVAEEYSLSAEDDSGDAVSGTVNVGFDGNDVYIQGLSSIFPDAWVKGTLSGNTVTFAANQLLGIYYYQNTPYYMYLNYNADDVVFTYDSNSGTLTAQNEVFEISDSQYYYDYYANCVIKKVLEKPGTPATPEITALKNGNYGYYMTFNIPTVDTEGNDMVTSKLSYMVYADVNKEVSPLTFTPATHINLTEDLTEIPYGFTEDWDFYSGTIYFNELFSEDWNKIGIKSIYRGGGETHESEIGWYTVKDYPTTAYYVVGEDSGLGLTWEAADANKMEAAATAEGLFTKTYEDITYKKDDKIEYKFLGSDGAWFPTGMDNNMIYTITEDGLYDVAFRLDVANFDPADAGNITVTRKGDIPHTYVVAGAVGDVTNTGADVLFGTGWAVLDDNQLTLDATSQMYTKVYEGVVLPVGTIYYKIVEDGTTWIPADNQTFDITEEGTYTVTVYYDPATQSPRMAAEKTGGVPAVLWTQYNFTNFNFNSANILCSATGITDGDINVDTGNLVITDAESGVKLTVTPATSGTDNRFWSTSAGPQLRMYSGTMTFEAPEGEALAKITFNNAKWNTGNTAEPGTLESNVWTGSANQVVITIAGNTQLNSIDVELGSGTTVKYYVAAAGTDNDTFLGTAWLPLDENQLTEADGGVYTKTYSDIEFAAGQKIQYVFCANIPDGAADYTYYPANDGLEYTVAEAGTYDVTFIFDPAASAWTVDNTIAVTKKGAAGPDKLYVIGTMNGWSLENMPEITFNEESKAFEFEVTASDEAYFAISDVASSESWDDFNANHRYAAGEGDVEIAEGQPIQLTKVNGTLVIKQAGVYAVSVTKDLMLSITKTGDIIPNIAELNKLEDKTPFTFGGDVLIVAKPTAKYVYVKDDTGSSLLYDGSGAKTEAAEVGKTIAANWTGKVSIYKSLFEAVPDNAIVVKDGEAATVTYPEAELGDVVADNVNQVVVLKGVTYSKPEGKNFNVYKGDALAAGYNQFNIEIADPEDGATYEIVGAIGRYTDNIQFQPITITKEEGASGIDKLYIIGDQDGWVNAEQLPNLKEMTFNTETNAFEYEVTVNEASYFAFGDVATVEGWDDFNANHRYAGGEGNVEVVEGQPIQLSKMAGDNSLVIKQAGIYTVSVTKDLLLSIKKTGEVGPGENILWSSDEPVAVNWGDANAAIDADKLANIQVGDVIHVAVEGVTPGSAWSAQVALFEGNWAHQLENGCPVGDGTVSDAAFVVTGDMLRLMKANGLVVTGSGYSTKKVTLETGVYAGSENSVWVGDVTLTWTQAFVDKLHLNNADVKAGDVIKLTYEATGTPNIQVRYGWSEGEMYASFFDVPTAEFEVTSENLDLLKEKGIIINADGIRLTQVELLPAGEPTPLEHLYVIGSIAENGWDMTKMSEVAVNETTKNFEMTDVTIGGKVYFAFSDVTYTEENWDDFNANHRYSVGAGDVDVAADQEIQLGKYGEGTLVFEGNGVYKLTITSDLMLTITKTGEITPTEKDYYVVGDCAPLGLSWSADEANKMEKSDTEGVYTKTYTAIDFAANDVIAFKFLSSGDEWYPDGMGNEMKYTVEEAGTYDVTFTFTPGQSSADNAVYTIDVKKAGESGLDGLVIAWNEGDVATAGNTADSYGYEDFLLNITDTDNKIAIDANTAYFGTATDFVKFTHRLKTGGKSSSKNSLTLTCAKEGTLKVYVRTGSNSATDRNLVLTQDDVELYNQVVKESDAIEVDVDNDPETPDSKVYPVISVEVKAGTVTIGYPTGSLNFYAFQFIPGTVVGIQNINNAAQYGDGAWYTLSGVRIERPTQKGLYIHNGKTVVVK